MNQVRAAVAIVVLLLLSGCAGPSSSPSNVVGDPEESKPRWRTDAEQARIPAAVADVRTPNVTSLTMEVLMRTLQAQPEETVLAGIAGGIKACAGYGNPNRVSVIAKSGTEIYHVPNGGTGDPVLVAQSSFGPQLVWNDIGYVSTLIHAINVSEVAQEGGESHYRARFWHEVLLPPEIPVGMRYEEFRNAAVPADPPLRGEAWLNITFEPFKEASEGSVPC